MFRYPKDVTAIDRFSGLSDHFGESITFAAFQEKSNAFIKEYLLKGYDGKIVDNFQAIRECTDPAIFLNEEYQTKIKECLAFCRDKKNYDAFEYLCYLVFGRNLYGHGMLPYGPEGIDKLLCFTADRINLEWSVELFDSILKDFPFEFSQEVTNAYLAKRWFIHSIVPDLKNKFSTDSEEIPINHAGNLFYLMDYVLGCAPGYRLEYGSVMCEGLLGYGIQLHPNAALDEMDLGRVFYYATRKYLFNSPVYIEAKIDPTFLCKQPNGYEAGLHVVDTKQLSKITILPIQTGKLSQKVYSSYPFKRERLAPEKVDELIKQSERLRRAEEIYAPLQHEILSIIVSANFGALRARLCSALDGKLVKEIMEGIGEYESLLSSYTSYCDSTDIPLHQCFSSLILPTLLNKLNDVDRIAVLDIFIEFDINKDKFIEIREKFKSEYAAKHPVADEKSEAVEDLAKAHFVDKGLDAAQDVTQQLVDGETFTVAKDVTTKSFIIKQIDEPEDGFVHSFSTTKNDRNKENVQHIVETILPIIKRERVRIQSMNPKDDRILILDNAMNDIVKTFDKENSLEKTKEIIKNQLINNKSLDHYTALMKFGAYLLNTVLFFISVPKYCMTGRGLFSTRSQICYQIEKAYEHINSYQLSQSAP